MVQTEAKAARRGLWADAKPTPPWEFRHPKKAVQTVAANDTECHIGPRGGHYRVVHGKKQYGC